MHLLLLTSSYPLYPDDASAAAGLFVRDFALELARGGHRVTVLTHERPGRFEPDSGVEVVRYAAPGLRRPLVRLRPWHPGDLWCAVRLVTAGLRASARLTKRSPVDHVLAMWAFPAGLYALALRRRFRVPYSVWTLGSDIHSLAKLPALRALIKRILREAAHRFADGVELAQATAELAGRPCTFLPSARSLPDGGTVPVIWPDSRGFHFVFVGRLEPVKGPDVLVEAAAILRDRGVRFGMALLGDGSLRPVLEERLRRIRLADRVALRGFVEPQVTAAYLAVCDAVVIPSRSESIPLVFSEALRAGAPLVVSDVGDLGELVRRHELGEVAAPGAPEGLATAMQRVMEGPREDWRRNALRLAPTFSVAGSAAAFLRAVGEPARGE